MLNKKVLYRGSVHFSRLFYCSTSSTGSMHLGTSGPNERSNWMLYSFVSDRVRDLLFSFLKANPLFVSMCSMLDELAPDSVCTGIDASAFPPSY